MRQPLALSAAFLALLAGCRTAPLAQLQQGPVTPAASVGISAVDAPAKAPLVIAQPAPDDPYQPQQLILSLEPGVSAADFLAQPQARGLVLLNEFPLNGRSVAVVGFGGSSTVASVRQQLVGARGLARTFTNTRLHPDVVPTTIYYSQQWAHHPSFANTEKAWDRVAAENIDATKVVIADIDTGVDSDHPSFGGRMMVGYQPTAFARSATLQAQLEPDCPAFSGDQFGHGTFVAGIAAADPAKGAVAGVAWKAWVYPIKVDHEESTGPTPLDRHWGKFDIADVVAGIQFAADHNAPLPYVQGQPAPVCDINAPAPTGSNNIGARVRVINLSLGASTLGVEALLTEAVAYARSKGILCIASTGNNGADQIPSPANVPGVVAVGATAHYLDKELLAVFSNYGPRIDVVAPGDAVYSTVPHTPGSELGSALGDANAAFYGIGSGTSEAAPYVSGLAALMFAKYDPNNASLSAVDPKAPAAMVDAVRAQLLKTCKDMGAPGWDPNYGWGRVDPDAALSAAVPLPAGTAPQY